jgi:hypothetical protein
LVAAICGAALVLSVGASSVLAGEITGNGTLKLVDSSKWGTGLHARSFCAFSGQEDLQWFTTNADITRHAPTRGVPGHAQSWGQFSKADRAALTSAGQNPGLACNPNKSTFTP